MGRKTSRLRRLGARLASHHCVQPDGQTALGFGRELAIKPLRNDEAENPVTEEFQPLIGFRASARVRKRPPKQLRLLESVR
jgi:hypothetical protein